MEPDEGTRRSKDDQRSLFGIKRGRKKLLRNKSDPRKTFLRTDNM
jgi:hypothetical protein